MGHHFAILIPARFGSTRYPGKPLAQLRGADGQLRSLIEHTWRAAIESAGPNQVWVATDDQRIADAVTSFGGQVVMTPKSCRNGTERCAAAIEKLGPVAPVVVNLQGDAPLTPTHVVHDLVKALTADPDAAMATPWQHLARQLGPATPELVLIGKRGWQAEPVFALLDTCPVLKGDVRELGCCDDATMLGWLDQAQALLMPSFIEGFGLPVVEALQRGTPVIASDLAVFREIAGDIPLYLDPSDLTGWAAAIASYCHDGSDRLRQLAAMPSYRAPTWAQHFAGVDALLQKLCCDAPA